MRICFISDVHANIFALEAVLRKTYMLGIDQYVCLGDIVGYGPHPVECIDVLSNLENISFVKGNHDYAVSEQEIEPGANRIAKHSATWTISQLNKAHLEWLQKLPLEERHPGYIYLHGSIKDPRRMYGYIYEMTYEENLEIAFQENLQIVFYGHTHIPFIHMREADGETLKVFPQKISFNNKSKTFLVNPGSVGQPRDGNPLSAFGVWDQKKNSFEFFRASYDVKKTIFDIQSKGLPADLGTRLEIGR